MRGSVQVALRCAVLAALLTGGVRRIAAEELSGFFPAGAEYAVVFNTERLLELPSMRKMLDGGDGENLLADQVAAFEDCYQLTIDDCRRIAFVGGGRNLRGVLIELGKPESELEKAFLTRGGGYAKTTIRNHTVHLLVDETLGSFGASKIGLSFLSPQVVLATEEEYLTPFFDALARGTQKFRPGGSELGWARFNVAAMTAKYQKKKKNDFFGSTFRDIRSIGVDFNTAGTGDDGWNLRAVAECVSAEKAQQLQTVLPSCLMLAANLLLANDSDLGMKFIKATDISADGANVTLHVKISPELAERFGSYFTSESIRRQNAPGSGHSPQTVNQR